MSITVDKQNSDVLVVETVCDLLELLSRREIWVRVAGDTSLSKFINTDKKRPISLPPDIK